MNWRLLIGFLCWLPIACCVIQLTQQSPLGLPCSGEEVVLQCTLPGILVFWGFPGGEETVAPSSTEQVTGNFRAQPVGVINGNFTSILTFPAQNGTVITCFNEDKTMNISHKVTVQGPPSVPTLFCVDLTEDVSGAVNVTVSWTQSGGDSADFYLISITTNATQIPYGGLLNITTANVTQHELTGFMTGYEYNITVRGVNCGSLVGRESEPLTFPSQSTVSLKSEAAITRNPPFVCRNELVKFTCEVTQATAVQWVSEPDVRHDAPIRYIPSDDVGETRRRGSCQSNLTHIERNPPFSNFSSELIVTPPESVKSVRAECGHQQSLCSSTWAESIVPITSAPEVPNQVLQVRVDRYNCPNISGVIQVDGIDDVTPLSYELTVSSSDGCAMQPCPMLLTPEQRAGLNFTLLAGVNYTVMLMVSNDCGFDYITVHIQPPECEVATPGLTPAPDKTAVVIAAVLTVLGVGLLIALALAVVIYKCCKPRSEERRDAQFNGGWSTQLQGKE